MASHDFTIACTMYNVSTSELSWHFRHNWTEEVSDNDTKKNKKPHPIMLCTQSSAEHLSGPPV